MTKPDTLASLIAKIPHTDDGGKHLLDYRTEELHFDENCLRCKLEAALDTLVEKSDANFEKWWLANSTNPDDEFLDTLSLHQTACLAGMCRSAWRACVAELRGRGASE